jgi:hypothetical protein
LVGRNWNSGVVNSTQASEQKAMRQVSRALPCAGSEN